MLVSPINKSYIALVVPSLACNRSLITAFYHTLHTWLRVVQFLARSFPLSKGHHYHVLWSLIANVNAQQISLIEDHSGSLTFVEHFIAFGKIFCSGWLWQWRRGSFDADAFHEALGVLSKCIAVTCSPWSGCVVDFDNGSRFFCLHFKSCVF